MMKKGRMNQFNLWEGHENEYFYNLNFAFHHSGYTILTIDYLVVISYTCHMVGAII